MASQPPTGRPFLLSALLLLAASTLPLAATEEPPDASTTVAVVNGESITLRDLEKRLEDLHGSVASTQRGMASVERLLAKLINDTLIGQEARALGLHEESPIPSSIERNRRRLALSVLEQVEIRPRSEPEAEEVEALFRERYRRASFHVLTAPDREGAEELLNSLRAGAEIGELARSRSIDPYAEQGGFLEDVARKDLQVSIADVLFNLEPNEVAGPVETDLGWSIVVAKSFQEGDPAQLDELRPRLERIVRRRKEDAARQALLEELRQRHEVVVDQSLIDSIQPQRLADGRLHGKSPEGDPVVARIGDEIVLTGDEYATALRSRWKTIPEEDAARAAAPIILETLINERLLLAEAYMRGYDELPAVERALHGLETEMLIPKYLQSVLAHDIQVSEEEKREHYEANKESFTRPPRMQLGQITVGSQEKAEEIAEALRSGTDLSWLAERHSTDGLRNRGGVQDWSIVRPDGGPFNQTLLQADTGKVLDPVERDDAWVVYKVLAREEQGLYPYEEISGNLREDVFRKKFLDVLDRFIQTARSRSEIEIREDVLAALRLTGSQTEEEGMTGAGHGGGHGGESGHGGHGLD